MNQKLYQKKKPIANFQIEQRISTSAKKICSKQHVYPSVDLFVVQGLTDENKRYVLFNTHFKDSYNGANSTQMFYLESEDENYTQLQKNIFKIFRDSRNKGYLATISRNNPFAKFSDGAPGNIEFAPTVNALAEISKEAPQSDMMDESGEYRPIIYSADAQYVRYKVYTTLFDKKI